MSKRPGSAGRSEVVSQTTEQGRKVANTIKDLDFAGLYTYYCTKYGLEPFSFIVDNAERNVLDLDVDMLPESHWKQIMAALISIGTGRSNTRLSFKSISLRWNERNDARHVADNRAFQTIKTAASTIVKDSFALRHIQITNENSKKEKNSNTPKFRHIIMASKLDINQTLKLLKALDSNVPNTLRKLEMEGLPLSKHCTAAIRDIIRRQAKSLVHISFRNAKLGDEVFEEIGKALPDCTNLSNIRLSGCYLTERSLGFLSTVIREKQERLATTEWACSLRNGSTSIHSKTKELPNFKVIDGYQEDPDDYDVKSVSLDLSNNFLSDSAAVSLSKLVGNMMRALDVSYNIIGSRGVNTLLEAVIHQKEFILESELHTRLLRYIDLSQNDGVRDANPGNLNILKFADMDLIVTVGTQLPKRSRPAKKKNILPRRKKGKSQKKQKKIGRDSSFGESESTMGDDVSTVSSMLSCAARLELHTDDTIQEKPDTCDAEIIRHHDIDQLKRDAELIHLRLLNQKLFEKMKSLKEQMKELKRKKRELEEENAQRKHPEVQSTGKVKSDATTLIKPGMNPNIEVTDDQQFNEDLSEIHRRLSQMWSE